MTITFGVGGPWSSKNVELPEKNKKIKYFSLEAIFSGKYTLQLIIAGKKTEYYTHFFLVIYKR